MPCHNMTCSTAHSTNAAQHKPEANVLRRACATQFCPIRRLELATVPPRLACFTIGQRSRHVPWACPAAAVPYHHDHVQQFPTPCVSPQWQRVAETALIARLTSTAWIRRVREPLQCARGAVLHPCVGFKAAATSHWGDMRMLDPCEARSRQRTAETVSECNHC